MADLGKAYVQIVPSAKGIGPAIQNQIDPSGKSAGLSLGKKLGGFAMKAFAAVEVGKFIKKTIEEGANYEQLRGGIEKIFDQANQSKIFEDATKAYKDLNLSANEYLGTITNVGAAFASSMGDQKGYDVARAGMLAVSDYATGTGKNVGLLNEKFQMISRSTSSYQSIADQFAGLLPQTSKDFLAQAQAAGFLSDGYKTLTEVPVAEYQQALVQMMQKGTDAMGLAGNTAAETEKTITGSFEGMKAALSNFMTQLVAGEDISGAMQTLFDSVLVFASNLVPAILSILEQLPYAIGTLATSMTEKLQDEESKAKMIEAAKNFLLSFGEGIIQNIPAVLVFLWELVQALFQFLIETRVELLRRVAEFLQTHLFSVIGEKFELIKSMISEKVQAIVTNVFNFFTNMKNGISERLQQAKTAAQEKFQSMKTAISTKVSEIVNTVREKFTAAKNAISDRMEAARDKVRGIIDKIKGFFKFKISWPKIPLPHFSISPSGWSVGDLLKGSIPKLSVNWYAKGGIFKKPTVLSGLGEAGAEAALPLDPFWQRLDNWGSSIIDGMALVAAGMQTEGDITVQTYLYPNGPKMDEYTYKAYNRGKARLGDGKL